MALLLWLRRRRPYHSTASVAAAYDRWTSDQLLERLWGEHIHLGHYGLPSDQRRHQRQDFRAVKAAFVEELARWSGLDQLPPGSRVLDVGCGIGGSSRLLARRYGLDVLASASAPPRSSQGPGADPPRSERLSLCGDGCARSRSPPGGV